MSYDALLFVSFGGPEGPDDVLPFMENVTRGRGIPRERLIEVSAHYQQFGGVSPINAQNRALIRAVEHELQTCGPKLPIYWGNRNWSPYLVDALRDMQRDGVRRALAFVTSAYSSYSGCRQYREDIQRAIDALDPADGPLPVVDKIRAFYNHPGFVDPIVDNTIASINEFLREDVSPTHLAFTAHSVPMSMAMSSDYVVQLREATTLVTTEVVRRTGLALTSELVYQSRSGAPGQPWLEPDICDHLDTLRSNGANGVVIVPIGFISDHMEVVYDLDTQAAERAQTIGLPTRRAATVGTDPRFVTMIRQLVEERIRVDDGETPVRLCVGARGPNHDVCPMDCCPAPQRPGAASGASPRANESV